MADEDDSHNSICKSESSLIHHRLQTHFTAAAEPPAGHQGQP